MRRLYTQGAPRGALLNETKAGAFAVMPFFQRRYAATAHLPAPRIAAPAPRQRKQMQRKMAALQKAWAKPGKVAIDEHFKKILGNVEHVQLPNKPGSSSGTYAEQYRSHKSTPSRKPVEIDHMTPDSLHQTVGTKRTGRKGSHLSRRLPAVAISKLLHRRKITTGSGEFPEKFRAYLLAVHKGLAPISRPMRSGADFNAAAMEVDLRSTTDQRAVKGIKSMHYPMDVTAPTHMSGVSVPKKDVLWSLKNTSSMFQQARGQALIEGVHEKHLESVAKELAADFKPPKPIVNFKSL